MRISVLKAYRIINISDKFFDEKMKDGFPVEMDDYLRFFNFDGKHALDSDYDRILKECKEGDFNGVIDEELSSLLNLRLQFTMLSNIMRH